MTEESPKTFPCQKCGADLNFKPGASVLACPYCGAETHIQNEVTEVQELDYHAWLAKIETEKTHEACITVRCDGCAAETTLEENVTAGNCPFCGTPIVAQNRSANKIQPEFLIPFHITRDQAAANFRTWLKRIWFAPNKLKEFAAPEGLSGMYCPYWTFDAESVTDYRGKRGTYYYTNETYNETRDGKSVTKTRRERHTRWERRNGRVANTFDDVLVQASKGLPEDIIRELEPWDLNQLVPYKADYLSGFRVESYALSLPQGFDAARERMEEVIRQTIKRDIGGDEQRINAMHPVFSDITFKHILLPVWISAYQYHDKVYRYFVNAVTGEVQGERPWSWVKIGLAAVAVTLVLIVFWYIANR